MTTLKIKAVSLQTFIDTPNDPHLAKSSDMLRTENIAIKLSNKEWDLISSAAEKIAEYHSHRKFYVSSNE